MHARRADIELVIFDCDGVLIDSEQISARMLIAALEGYGISIDPSYVARHFLGRSYPVVLAQIRKEFGIELPLHFEEEYRSRLLAAFDKELEVMPGLPGVLDRLGVPFCAATSSSPRRVAHSLQLTGLSQRFADRVFTASQVARGKPAPDLFIFAAERMRVAPERCLVIEDSETGVRAGLAAGMRVCRFVGGSHLAGGHNAAAIDGVDHVLPDFGEFFAQFPELSQHGAEV